jgi:type I restriction enzyme S subunit
MTITPALPSDWRWVQIGEVCALKTGTRNPQHESNGTFVYVDISCVNNKTKKIVTPTVIKNEDAPSRARQVIRVGDVLVSTTRPNLNAVAMVPEELDNAICSTGFCVLRATDDVLSSFLFLFVCSTQFVQALSEMVKGALYPAGTDTQVKQQRIPLPPLAEQQRIVAILDDQIAAVERARAAVDARLVAAKMLSKTYIRETYTRVEQAHPTVARLGDVLHLRKEIVHPRDNSSGAAQFVGLEHIESETGVRIGELDVQMETLTGRKPKFHQGDIVYGYLRPYLNKVWVAEFDGLCSVDQYVYIVDHERADTQYIAWFMRSAAYLNRAPIDRTPGQLPRIRTEEVASVALSLPSLPEQRRVVTRLAAQLEAAERVRRALETQRHEMDMLSPALLRQAFTGTLKSKRNLSAVPRSLPQGIVFTRGAIASYILDKTYRQPTMGRVKFEKMLYLSETHVGIDLYGNYERKAAGPLDANYLINLESLARKQRWFYRHDRGGEGYFYRPGDAIADRVRAAVHILGERRELMDAMLHLFAPFGTERTEIVTTLFAAWNDFLIDGYVPSDTTIVSEVLERWHEAKQRIPEQQWRDALRWMRSEGFVPTGIGPRTETGNG